MMKRVAEGPAYQPHRSSGVDRFFFSSLSRPSSVGELFWENTKIHGPLVPLDEHDPVTHVNLDAELNDVLVTEHLVASGGKKYPGATIVPLPPPRPLNKSLATALSSRRSIRSYNPSSPIHAAAASAILKAGYGWRPTRGYHSMKRSKYVPSAGALYPCQVYLASVRVTKPMALLTLYHYEPDAHALEKVRKFTASELHAVFGYQVGVDECAAVMFVTGVLGRLGWKYGARGLRYLLLDAGHIMQNMCLAAVACGVSSCPVVGYYDDEVHDLLRIDGSSEVVVYTLLLGMPSPQGRQLDSNGELGKAHR